MLPDVLKLQYVYLIHISDRSQSISHSLTLTNANMCSYFKVLLQYNVEVYSLSLNTTLFLSIH